ncbi:hypothetical protein WISP_139679 [Willisornis vidua]|uniref:Uncharacterized protein n=1 Tax=Willisornis vidua TaxID=1566151 RepID=A0ABQ9CT13_9PASS|nr:hypothetical protein WISP_139679 [Willisornis vidua]
MPIGAAGSGPEDFPVPVQARLAVADEPQELKGGASSVHAEPHLKHPPPRLEGLTQVGRALPKSLFMKSNYDDDDDDQ